LYQPGSVKSKHPSVIACDDRGYRGHGADTKEIKARIVDWRRMKRRTRTIRCWSGKDRLMSLPLAT